VAPKAQSKTALKLRVLIKPDLEGDFFFMWGNCYLKGQMGDGPYGKWLARCNASN
jgi:hypothetical protein